MKRILPLCLFALATLPAAELAIRDVHVALTNRPSDFDFDLKSSTAKISGSDSFDGGLSLEVGGRWSFTRTGDSVGLVAGLDLAADAQSYGGGDGLSTLWGRGALGVGWAVADRVTLIGEGLAGYGLSTLSLPATSQTAAFEADGNATSFEARVTGLWQFTRSFGAGLSAGWLIASHDLTGNAIDLTLDQNGWYVGLTASWRISDSPPALE